jgi:hypothetical protein
LSVNKLSMRRGLRTDRRPFRKVKRLRRCPRKFSKLPIKMMTVEERETGDRHLVGGPLIDAKTTFNFANKQRGQPGGVVYQREAILDVIDLVENVDGRL